MKSSQKGSALVSLIVLVAVLYGAFLAIQYVPIAIESSSVDSILENLEKGHRTERAGSVQDVKDRIGNFLNINQMDDLQENFDASHSFGNYVVNVSYERELNLLFDRKALVYEKSVTLRQ
jgi:hypothetical protein